MAIQRVGGVVFKRRAFTQTIRPLVVLAGVAVALLVGQSCSDNDEITEPELPVQWEIDTYPAWSPDGSKIIFLRERSKYVDTNWVWGVFLHDVALGKDSLLWQGVWAHYFDWSPDGLHIACSFNGRIYISDLQRTASYQIVGGENLWFPRWSPCGDRIMYFIRAGAERGMYLFNWFDSTSEFKVPYATSGDWLSHCDTVALIDFKDTWQGAVSVYDIPADSLTVSPFIEGYKRFITVSPHGRDILIGRDGGANYTNIWKLNIVSGTYSQLTNEGGDYPAWSPDGQWIVYTKLGDDNGHLWLMRPDGSEKHQITF